MCGIVGYIGEAQAAPILLAGLGKLEYRGYDSAGIAVRNEATGKIEIVKEKGRLRALVEKTDNGKAVPGTCGVGHTRWATHGEPSAQNAHPHCTEDRSVVLVHNGIIEELSGTEGKASEIRLYLLFSDGYRSGSKTQLTIITKRRERRWRRFPELCAYSWFLCLWHYVP